MEIDDENNGDHDTVRNPGSIRGNGIVALDTDVLVPIIRRDAGAGPLLKKVRSLFGNRNTASQETRAARRVTTDVVIESIERAVSYLMRHPTTREVAALQQSCTSLNFTGFVNVIITLLVFVPKYLDKWLRRSLSISTGAISCCRITIASNFRWASRDSRYFC